VQTAFVIAGPLHRADLDTQHAVHASLGPGVDGVFVLIVENVYGTDGETGRTADALAGFDHHGHEKIDRSESTPVEFGAPCVWPLMGVGVAGEKCVIALTDPANDVAGMPSRGCRVCGELAHLTGARVVTRRELSYLKDEVCPVCYGVGAALVVPGV
jgi:hypothetical protein